MPVKFIVYCTIVLGYFVYASNNGIVYSSLFNGSGAAQKNATVYHK